MTEQTDLLPEDRIAKLEARMDSLQQRLLSTQELAYQNRGILEKGLTELLALLRWAYSHCKSHGHSLRLNDFLVAGNDIKATLAEIDDE